MKYNANTESGLMPRQRELLERRAECLGIIRAALHAAGLSGDLEAPKVFTDIFLKSDGPDDGPMPVAFIYRAATNHAVSELRRRKAADETHRTYAMCRPDPRPSVAGIAVDDINWSALANSLEGDSRAEQLGKLIASSLADSGRVPTQGELADAMGIHQSVVSRSMPDARRVLRQAIEAGH